MIHSFYLCSMLLCYFLIFCSNFFKLLFILLILQIKSIFNCMVKFINKSKVVVVIALAIWILCKVLSLNIISLALCCTSSMFGNASIRSRPRQQEKQFTDSVT